ncbi:MAG: hypothetical protein QOF16_1722 [Actinomycetota bacterium]|nr:hypothetical protein [Actinomycetota bacterium]
MPSNDRLSRWLIAGGVGLCITVLAAVIVVVATGHVPSTSDTVNRRTSTQPTPTVLTSVGPSPSSSASEPPQPPVDPLAEIDQAQLVACIRATGALPGAHSQPDLTHLPASHVVHLVARADESVRQLHFTAKVPFEFIHQKEMDRRVVHMSLASYSPAQAKSDSEILALLGAVPPATDLRTVAKQALGGQVAGFYDDRTRKLVVGTGGKQLSPSEVTTLAHELDHALVDQGLGFPSLHDGSALLADESLARHALLEGDAVLDQTFFEFSYLSVDQQLQTSHDPAAARADRQLAAVPHYLTAGFLFPYTAGLNFVCSLYLDGGWPAVDEAYFKPPTSTAQIMWPDRYRSHEAPVIPRPPETPAGWRVASRSALGAADLKALFEAPGNDAARALHNPQGRARAWAGGRVELFRAGQQSALAMDLVQHRHTHDLCSSIRSWYQRAFPDALVVARSHRELSFDGTLDAASIRCTRGDVRLGIAPTADVAHALAL